MNTTAETIWMVLLEERNLFARNWGMVMESLAQMEYLRSFGAMVIQASTVPISSPTEIQILESPAM